MLSNEFDLYLESFSENYEVFTEGAIKDKAKIIIKAVIKIVKTIYEKIKKLFDLAISKFKAAFSKDKKLMEKVDEIIEAEKSGNYRAEPTPSYEPETKKASASVTPAKAPEPKSTVSKPEKQTPKPTRAPKPEKQTPKPLLLTSNIITVRFRRFMYIFPSNIIRAGMSPISDEVIRAMQQNNICDDDYKLNVSVEELKKFMLNRRLYDLGTQIAYSTDSPEELIRSIFFKDDEYKEYTIDSLGGIEQIKYGYDWCKKIIPELSKEKQNTEKRMKDIIEGFNEEIKDWNNDINELKSVDDAEKREMKTKGYNRHIKRLEFQKYCVEVFAPLGMRYVEEALNCTKEAYQMSKAALIKCVGSASNFSESQIERVVKVAMIETEMCFV